MRIKRLDLHHPAILAGVAADKLQPRVERPRLRMVALVAHIRAVDAVLLKEHPAIAGEVDQVFLVCNSAHDSLPSVALLSPEALPRAVPPVVGRAAILPIVGVVADEMGVDAVSLEDFRHGIVKRLDRPPAPVQEVIAPRVQLPPRGHAGKAARIAGVKLHGAPGQAGKVRRMRLRAAIGLKHMPVERIVHHDDGSHGAFLLPHVRLL